MSKQGIYQISEQKEVYEYMTFVVSILFYEFYDQINIISSLVNPLHSNKHQWNEQKTCEYLDKLQIATKQFGLLIDEVLKINWAEAEDEKNFLPKILFLKQFIERQAMLRKFYKSESGHICTQPCLVFSSIPKINQVLEFIEANYHQQITVCSIAKTLGYSSTYLSNLVKSKTGQTIHRLIVECRMAKARALLINTDLSINQIAAAVGYPDAGHFSRQFRQIYNVAPKTWRNMRACLKSGLL